MKIKMDIIRHIIISWIKFERLIDNKFRIPLVPIRVPDKLPASYAELPMKIEEKIVPLKRVFLFLLTSGKFIINQKIRLLWKIAVHWSTPRSVYLR